MIRRAEQRDVPRLVELGEEFAYASQPVHGFSVSREKIIQFANHTVNDASCVFYVLEEAGVIQGFIVGIIEEIYFSKDVALHELAWYVKNGYGGLKLFLTFEACAKDIGCKHLVVGNKPEYYDLGLFYKRRDFKLLENQYVKRL